MHIKKIYHRNTILAAVVHMAMYLQPVRTFVIADIARDRGDILWAIRIEP